MSKHTNRLAVFADLHYTCGSAKLKGRVLREALDAALSLGTDGIVCAGDMIGTGTIAEASELRAIFDSQPLPVWFTPGNAELRTPSESATANAILSNRAPLPDGVILIDSSAGYPSECRMQNAECRMCSEGQPSNCQTVKPSNCAGRDVGDREKPSLLAVTHVPPGGGAIGLTVAGHLHIDAVREGGACRVLRGLDPDKAIGGPPSFATFVRDADGVWHFEANHEIRGIRPSEWTPAFRDAFLRDLGLSTMYDPFGGLAFATENHIQAVELRHSSWGDDARALGEAIARWRDAGGRILSMHLPSLRFANGVADNVDAIAKSCETARAIGCDRVTLHVPKMPVLAYDMGGPGFVRAAYARALVPLEGTAIAIGIENMHMTAGETPDNRNFGYTPGECQTLLADLRRIPSLNIGFHLDIGHARNNAPYSTLFPVGTWYEQLGTECNGMHIHQVVMDEKGQMHNHKPLLGFFDKLISLSSLILARRDGLLNPAPMFIEVRDGQGPASWSALTLAVSAE
jgi:sugar phosphate isomerase/epimerase